MEKHSFLKENYAQFLYTLYTFPQAVKFARKHRIWHGFWHYSWVGRLLLFIAVLAGLKFLQTVLNHFEKLSSTDDPIAVAGSMGVFLQDVIAEEYQFFFQGNMQFFMIILLEIVIFHVTRRSLQILTGKTEEASMKGFLKAQKRMIMVVVVCAVLIKLVEFGLSPFFAKASVLHFLKPPVLFLFNLFLLGFAVVDNYFEIFGCSIKESFKHSQHYIGLVLGIGTAVYLLFLIPVIGTIIAPFLAAITSTLVLCELCDLHLQPEPVPAQVITQQEDEYV